jgi:hypothetical protein
MVLTLCSSVRSCQSQVPMICDLHGLKITDTRSSCDTHPHVCR